MLLIILSLLCIAAHVEITDGYGCSEELKDLHRYDQSFFEDYKGLCLRYQLYNKAIWQFADSSCQKDGGTLVMPDSEAFNAHLKSVLESYYIEEVWIGLSDRITEGHFVWDNNKNLTGKGFFAKGEGWNHLEADSQNCVAFQSSSGLWKDEVCSSAYHSGVDNDLYFVCQYDV